ncbi:MAG: IS200/IS605 family accessory protein TnpB-related protein [Conexivisphaerales archaeon]
MAIAYNISDHGIVVKGSFLKSMNQYPNKNYAYLKSIDSMAINLQKWKLFLKRNRKNAMHIISRKIVEYAKSRGIDAIVIGHNNGWKQSVEMGNNQNFVQIPFNTLR